METLNWTEIIITFITVFLAPLAAMVLKMLYDWVESKVDNEKLKAVNNIIYASVRGTKQKLVDHLKNTEQWDDATGEQIKNMVKDEIMRQLSHKTIKHLKHMTLDVDAFVDQSIESTVDELNEESCDEDQSK